MSVYDINGNDIYESYAINGQELSGVYNVLGNKVNNSGGSEDPYIPNRLLIYEDNFNYINNNTWGAEIGPLRGVFFFRENNISIENGKLVCTLKKENHGGKSWTTGSLTTHGKRSWGYGRFEAKIKMEEVHAFNSAFWMLGNSIGEINTNDDGTRDYRTQGAGIENNTTWTECGEIDIVETIPGDSKRPTCNLWDNAQNSIGSGAFPSDIDITQWHIYAMEWTSEYIAMYIDGTEYKRWVFSNYSQEAIKAYITEPMAVYFVMGMSDWLITEDTPTEGKMYVDWFRVYAENGVTEEIKDESIHIQETMRLKKGCVAYTSPVITPYNTSDRTIIWVSDDDAIVRCENGCIYGEEIGEANIYVISANKHISKCHVTVIDPSDPIVQD